MTARRVSCRKAVVAVLAGASALSLHATDAHANAMDLAPERLRLCQGPDRGVACGDAAIVGGEIVGNYYRADNAAWAKLVSQYAMAMAPTAMHPARTTGYGGFEMSIFGTMTTIEKDKNLERGTEGPITEGKKYSSSNGSPDGTLSVFGVTGRKGLPYGFELQGQAGYMANTEYMILGGGIRLAPFEGWRKWFDLSVGGYVNTLTGTPKVKITVPAFDVQVSRRFVISNQVIIQPYLGWQMVWINADSGVIDTTPQREGLRDCNARPSTPEERNAGDTGEFRCQSRGAGGLTGDAAPGSDAALSKLDLNNNVVFRNMRAFRRQRAMFGFTVRWESAFILLHAMTDLINPEDGEPDPDPVRTTVGGVTTVTPGTKRLIGLPKQWTFGAMIGLSW